MIDRWSIREDCGGKWIRMNFNKKRFLENAPVGIKRQLKEQLDILDGLEVIFDGRVGKDGYIPQYFYNGQEYYLYPVYRNWCVK